MLSRVAVKVRVGDTNIFGIVVGEIIVGKGEEIGAVTIRVEAQAIKNNM